MALDEAPAQVEDDLLNRILQGNAASPLPFLQEVPSASRPSEAYRTALEKIWTFNVDGDAWDCLTIDETSVPTIERDLWNQSFPARSSVEPVLSTYHADKSVKHAEVDIEVDDVAAIYDHALKQYVQKDNQAVGIVQGKAAETSSSEISKIIDEAEAPVWIEELRSGNLPQTYAPGLNVCLTGARLQQGLVTATASSPAAGEVNTNGITELEGGGTKFKLGDILAGLWVVDDADVEQEDEKGMEKQGSDPEPETQYTGILQAQPVDDMQGDNDKCQEDKLSASQPDKDGLDELHQIFPPTSSSISTKSNGKQISKSKKKGTEWAVTNSIGDLDKAYAEIRGSMAMQFPFELDTFQKEAICNLEMGRSVFVAAHTSAGKTVVAEYAFALATKHCTRAVYTSPIKTISNQKFRDFSGNFEVGLMTGDVQIRPNAPCLIMTTEILRSMLYKGADLIRDMEFVIFDEVHYVNDADRGVVWEETIIMLPPHCSIVLLSATVPNVKDFAGWVGRTKRKEVHVSATQKRPVPLEHSLFYGSKLYPICKNDKFTVEGLQNAKADYEKKNKLGPAAQDAPLEQHGRGGRGRNSGGRSRGRNGGRDSFRGGRSGQYAGGSGRGRAKRSNVNRNLLQLLKKSELLPSVIFAFSKKWCDNSARELTQMDLTTSKEKHEIHIFCEKALSRLNETDRQLPQIIRIKDMLKRGIAVHHAGLLPIIKEIVEMLFCRGLVQVLFATETFAMGVNAPARAVVFNSLEKHDGQEFRMLLAGEYTQMSGRAGRRGLDKVGTVIICCSDELPKENDLRKLLQGRGLQLTSRFRLTYSMILNLMRVEDLKVEDMLKRSFAEHHAQKAQPDNLAQVEKAENAIKLLRNKEWPACYRECSRSDMEAYHKQTMLVKEINERNNKQFLSSFHLGKKIQESIKVGQTVLACDASSGLLAAGVVCGHLAQKQSKANASQILNKQVCLLSLHMRGPWQKDAHAGTDGMLGNDELMFKGAMVGKNANGWGPLPQYGKKAGSAFRLAEVDLSCIIQVYKEKLSIDAEDILQNCDSHHLAPALKKLKELETKICKDRASTVETKLNELVLEMKKRDTYIKNVLSMPCHRCACTAEGYASIHTEHTLKERLSTLRHNMSDATLKQMPEFENRVRVLEHLGYVDETGTVKLKGRVACEINSGDEVVTTEMIFCGFLTELDAEEAVALVSAFVFQEKTTDTKSLTPRLEDACESLRTLCMDCAKAQAEFGLEINPEQFCDETLNFGLVEVVYQWAKGTPFKEICSLTSIMEGSIVRTIVRLEQACREIMDAARVMGNTSLFVKMQQASCLIKRDVIFAASLYVS